MSASTESTVSVTQIDGSGLSAWQQRMLDRSLKDAKRRALAKGGGFVESALELVHERGSVDFTLQDVVDRTGRSLRSFYQYFPSKDELLVALFEESISSLVTVLHEAIDDIADPVEKLEVYTRTLWAMAGGATGDSRGANRAMTAFHRQLAVSHPDELSRAFAPQRQLVHEIVAQGVAEGVMRSDIDPGELAELFLECTLGSNHAAVLQEGDDARSVEPLWLFCLAAIRPQ